MPPLIPKRISRELATVDPWVYIKRKTSWLKWSIGVSYGYDG